MDNELASMMTTLEKIRKNTEKNTPNSNTENKTTRSIKENSVTKSNALARAYYRYNIVEKRIMEAMVSRLHPQRGDNELQDIKLTAADYSKVFNVNRKVAYRDLERAVSGLMQRVISIGSDHSEGGRFEYTLMSRANYQKEAGQVTCSFNPLIVPHLVGLKEKFRSYPLNQVVDFKSSYTWRMYEILLTWSQPKSQTGGLLAGWLQIEVDELRKMLGVPESYRFDQLQKQVLDKAASELREKVSIYLYMERIKTSRKVTHLNIQFIQKEVAGLT